MLHAWEDLPREVIAEMMGMTEPPSIREFTAPTSDWLESSSQSLGNARN